MTKRSKSERAKRTAENEAVVRIEAAWQASVPTARANEFAKEVAAAACWNPLFLEPVTDPAHRLDRGTSGVLLFALDRDIGRQGDQGAG